VSTLEAVAGIANEARTLANAAKGEISSHEAVCAERYTNINQQLGWIWKILALAGVSLLGMLGFLAKTEVDSLNSMQRVLDDRTQQILIQQHNVSPPKP